ncbi:hypothetical protein [Pseudofrankia sp. DC12]|uniref:hypothetical protein n=1 Tax=Pseudofrankia sp. DC12 TaxID=683315 RepID=UPI0005F7F08B|nr:hypothetical protein [Pseudofrankia sp. DC12]
MWSLDAPDAAGERPRPPWEIVLFAAFCGLLVLAAVFAVLPPGRATGAGILIVFTALITYRAPVFAGVALGVLTWLFDLGFVVHTEGDLGIPTAGEWLLLAALLATGALCAGVGWVARRSPGRRTSRRAGRRGRFGTRTAFSMLPHTAPDNDWTGLMLPRQREDDGVRR